MTGGSYNYNLSKMTLRFCIYWFSVMWSLSETNQSSLVSVFYDFYIYWKWSQTKIKKHDSGKIADFSSALAERGDPSTNNLHVTAYNIRRSQPNRVVTVAHTKTIYVFIFTAGTE